MFYNYLLLLSFIIKTLYKSHVQEFLRDMKVIIRRFFTNLSESLRPSLYDILPSHWRRTWDAVDAILSYVTGLFATTYLIAFLILSKYINWSDFTLKKGVIYFGYIIIFMMSALACIASGNKAVQRLRGDRRWRDTL